MVEGGNVVVVFLVGLILTSFTGRCRPFYLWGGALTVVFSPRFTIPHFSMNIWKIGID